MKDFILKCPTKKHWEKIGIIPHHGILMPLFSLHSQKNSGIGEFYDLLPIIPWLKSLGMDLLQLLPLNDTAYDPSPYNAISSLALNHVYLSLHALPYLEKNIELQEGLKEFAPLNLEKRVNYTQVYDLKLKWLKHYFLLTFNLFENDPSYQKFISNSSWLEEYALFKAIKADQNEAPFLSWPQNLQDISDANYKNLLKRYSADLNFYYFLQYLCHMQLKKVSEFAKENHLFLIGDLSFLVSLDSVDVWKHPQMFDKNLIAGAPKDALNQSGQKWNFPAFNLEEMKKSNYFWWKNKVQNLALYFDIYRIDHVVGLFRLWVMTKDEEPLMGRYNPQNPLLWESTGKTLLMAMIKSSSILPIAEDLGIIPPVTYKVLHELGICGIKILRWQKDEKGFFPFNSYDPLSVTSLSTPDLEPLALWWQNFPNEAKKFSEFKHWAYSPTLSFAKRKDILSDSHHTSSIFHLNLLQEYLALFDNLISDNLQDERINVPGTVLPTNWSYKFRPSVEEIISHKELSKNIKEILRYR
ncbi:MAG: 4-alpha-glucanotransferase [Chlamydiae bacterium]|nr:4-alpha-glucanotransferase [Chlamydiota bacterium]